MMESGRVDGQLWLRPGERLDDLQRKGYKIIQNDRLFCFGMDAVLLCAFARVRRGARVLDLGTGNGVIPILLEARTEDASFTGIEICAESADMAARSVKYNGLEGKITIIEGDIRQADRFWTADSFDVVTSNPPYMTKDHGLINPDIFRAAARHEILCTLEDVVAQAARALKMGGCFYLVHRPFRMAEIFRALDRHHLEPKRVRLVYPFVEKEPNMILIEALKGGKPRVTVEPPLIVYREPGVYTEELVRMYTE